MPLPPLRDYQSAAAESSHSVDRLAYLWSPRLGKSNITLDFLVTRNVKRAVITCPLVVAPQWLALVAAAGMNPINGHKGPVSDLQRRLKGDGVLVINDDRLRASQRDIIAWRPDAFVGDESHRFRGVSSERGKAMRQIAKTVPLIRLLTGTPTPNHVGNLWGQMTAINEKLWGRSYEKFATRFLIRDSMFKSKVLGVIHEEELRSMLLESANILRREDIYGGDNWLQTVREVSLPPGAQKLYDRIVKEWVAENQLGLDETFSATHMLTRMLRLQQLTSGYIPDVDGTIHEVHTAKLDLVVNDLEDIINSDEKAVVFHKFTWEGETYARDIERRLGCKVVSINGSTSPRDREIAIRTINESGPPCVAVVQTQAGGIGISLAGAAHALFVSQSFSFADEEQARDRIYQPGVAKVLTFYRCMNTIDTYIARALEAKENIHQAVRSADVRELAYGVPTLSKRGIV